MSVHFEAARNRWVVRWREDDRNRSRTFGTLEAAEAFDAAIRPPREVVAPAPPSPHGDGIYPYNTRAGVRFRFVFRQSDGTMPLHSLRQRRPPRGSLLGIRTERRRARSPSASRAESSATGNGASYRLRKDTGAAPRLSRKVGAPP